MGVFDSIGGAFGGLVEGVEDIGKAAMDLDPIKAGINVVGNALGLDPKITGALEAVAGFATGDLSCAIGGIKDIMSSKDGASAPPAGSTGAAPGADSGYADPPVHQDKHPAPVHHDPASKGVDDSGETYEQALKTIQQNFDLLDTAAGVGKPDGLIGRNDLQAILKNPNAPEDLKKAAKFMLDNPAYFNQSERAQFGGKLDGLLGKGDVDAMIKKLDAQGGTEAPKKTDGSTSTDASGNSDDPKKADGSDTTDASSSADDAQFNQDLNAILNDPHMSMEEKVLAILMKLEEKQEKAVNSETKQLAQVAGKTDDASKSSQSKIQMDLQQAMSKMNELQSLASNIEKAFNQTHMSIIGNIR